MKLHLKCGFAANLEKYEKFIYLIPILQCILKIIKDKNIDNFNYGNLNQLQLQEPLYLDIKIREFATEGLNNNQIKQLFKILKQLYLNNLINFKLDFNTHHIDKTYANNFVKIFYSNEYFGNNADDIDINDDNDSIDHKEKDHNYKTLILPNESKDRINLWCTEYQTKYNYKLRLNPVTQVMYQSWRMELIVQNVS